MSDSEKLNEVLSMANSVMNQTFIYKNMGYRLSDNWNFKLKEVKTANGQCQYSRFLGNTRNIILSSWVIVRVDRDVDFWKGILLHEMAHAIDIEIRGYSNHDYHWKDIAIAIGGDSRTVSVPKWSLPMRDKYISTCSSCGHVEPITDSIYVEASCGTCYPHAFNRDYLRVVTLNENYIE